MHIQPQFDESEHQVIREAAARKGISLKQFAHDAVLAAAHRAVAVPELVRNVEGWFRQGLTRAEVVRKVSEYKASR